MLEPSGDNEDFTARVLANPGAEGKAIALYTCAPTKALAQAELQFLLERAIADYPDKKIVGYMDVDPAVKRSAFIGAYRGKDRQRFFQILHDIEKA